LAVVRGGGFDRSGRTLRKQNGGYTAHGRYLAAPTLHGSQLRWQVQPWRFHVPVVALFRAMARSDAPRMNAIPVHRA
jgi:hypothetical protein